MSKVYFEQVSGGVYQSALDLSTGIPATQYLVRVSEGLEELAKLDVLDDFQAELQELLEEAQEGGWEFVVVV